MKLNMTIALLLLMGWCGAQQKSFLIVGTYTGGNSRGIYVYEFSNNNANATFRSVRWAENPSFLAASSNGKFIYAVNENGSNEPGKETGGITAFSFNRKTATLDSINNQPSGGNHPCYVTIDKTGKWLWAGNYSSGSMIEYQLDQQSGALKKDRCIVISLEAVPIKIGSCLRTYMPRYCRPTTNRSTHPIWAAIRSGNFPFKRQLEQFNLKKYQPLKYRLAAAPSPRLPPHQALGLSHGRTHRQSGRVHHRRTMEDDTGIEHLPRQLQRHARQRGCACFAGWTISLRQQPR